MIEELSNAISDYSANQRVFRNLDEKKSRGAAQNFVRESTVLLKQRVIILSNPIEKLVMNNLIKN